MAEIWGLIGVILGIIFVILLVSSMQVDDERHNSGGLIARAREDYIEKSKIEGQRKRTLSNTANWTMHIVLETLNMVGIINDEVYRQLNKFRYKRNRVIHRGENVTKEEAEECYQNALEFMKNYLEAE